MAAHLLVFLWGVVAVVSALCTGFNCLALLLCRLPVAWAGSAGAIYLPPARRPVRYRPPPGANQAQQRQCCNDWRRDHMPRLGGGTAGGRARGGGAAGGRGAGPRRGRAAEAGEAVGANGPGWLNPPGLEGAVGHDSHGGRFGEWTHIARLMQHRDVRRYLGRMPQGVNPLRDAVEIWPDAPVDAATPLAVAHLIYLNSEGSVKSRRIDAPGRACNFSASHCLEAQRLSATYTSYQLALVQSRAAAACLVDSLGLARGQTLADVCGGEAAGAACAWESGVRELRQQVGGKSMRPIAHSLAIATAPTAWHAAAEHDSDRPHCLSRVSGAAHRATTHTHTHTHTHTPPP